MHRDCLIINATAEMPTMIRKCLEKGKDNQGGLANQGPKDCGQMMMKSFHGYNWYRSALVSQKFNNGSNLLEKGKEFARDWSLDNCIVS